MSIDSLSHLADIIVEGKIIEKKEVDINGICYEESIIEVSAILKGERDFSSRIAVDRCVFKDNENKENGQPRISLHRKNIKGLFFLKSTSFKEYKSVFSVLGFLIYTRKSRFSTGINLDATAENQYDFYRNIYAKVFPVIDSITEQEVYYLQDEPARQQSLTIKIIVFSFISLLVGSVFVASIYNQSIKKRN